jgi:hypothetical protein
MLLEDNRGKYYKMIKFSYVDYINTRDIIRTNYQQQDKTSHIEVLHAPVG